MVWDLQIGVSRTLTFSGIKLAALAFAAFLAALICFLVSGFLATAFFYFLAAAFLAFFAALAAAFLAAFA